MSALEAITKQIARNTMYECPNCGEDFQYKIYSPEFVAASLLALKQDCAECDGKGVIIHGEHPYEVIINCDACHSSGKSPYNVIYEACQDQTPPKNPFKDDMTFERGYIKWAGYDRAQQDMLTPSIDSNGRKTVWLKVYTE